MAGATQLEPYNHDLGNAEIQNVKLQSLSTNPTGLEAKIYWNSATKEIRYFDGTTWQAVGTASGTDTEAVQDIVGAQIVGGAAVTSTYDDAGSGSITLDVAVDGSSIEVNADALRVKASGITDAMLAGSISNSKLATNPLARANHTGTQAISTVQVSATARILGRTTAAAGPGEELTASQVKTMLAISNSDVSGLGGAALLNVGTGAGTVAAGDDSRLSNARTPTAHASTHLSNGADPIAAATTSVGGLMSASDKTKLDGVATGATANVGTVTNVTGTAPIVSSGGATPAISITAATTGAAGSMSSSDKTKLDGIATAATANATDAALRDRATHTGTQTAATISNFDTQVRTSRLDQMAAPTASVALNSQKITGLADGTAATDAATFGQLNSVVTGLKWKDPVRVVATTNLTLSGTQTIDGVSCVAGDRVLAASQTTASARGMYVVAAGAWARATDADLPAELNGATVLATEGTAGAGDVYTQTATVVTVGTTSQTWVKVGEGNTVYGADGSTLQLTGTTFSIKAQGVVASTLGAIAGDGIGGGSGAVLTADVATIPRIVTGTLTGGSTSEVLTHNLGTRNIASVEIANNSSPYDTLKVPYERTSTNSVTIYSVSNLPAGYTWTIVGKKA